MEPTEDATLIFLLARRLIVVILCFASACSGEVNVASPDEEPDEGQDRLSVNVFLASEDSALGSALGWSEGRVPDARVKLLRETSGGGVVLEEATTARTDPTRTVEFTDLFPGNTYRVSVSRELSDAEVAAASQVRADLRTFGAGTKSRFPGETSVTLKPNRANSIVISEISNVSPSTGQPGAEYDFAFWVELYNNSDRTVYLDGMVIGRAYSFKEDFPPFPCEQTRRFQVDSTGIWVRFAQAFPGSGSDYPLAPGEFVVVATDAADHSEIAPYYLDMTDADFEFHGPSDVNNPDVPDMIPVGVVPWTGPGGQSHGLDQLTFLMGNLAMFLSKPFDSEGLPRGRPIPGRDEVYVKVPAEKLADAVFTVWADEGVPNPLCQDVIHDRFDELAYVWKNPDPLGPVLQRTVAGRTSDSRAILLDTNTSQVDFRLLPQSPWALPHQ